MNEVRVNTSMHIMAHINLICIDSLYTDHKKASTDLIF